MVARACAANPNVLHRWRWELPDHGAKTFSGNGKMRNQESQSAELERKVDLQVIEIDFLRGCCALDSQVKWQSDRECSRGQRTGSHA